MKLTRKLAIGIKQETTQGTAVVPATATDYLEVENFEVQPVPERLQRAIAYSTLDKAADVIGKRYCTVSFERELKGSGTRGDATIAGFAGFHAAIQACAYVPVVAASQSVALVAVDDGGTGYTLPPTIGFSGGGGSGATAVAVVSGGVLMAIFVTNPGSGYTTDPSVTITPVSGGSGATASVTRGGSILYGPVSNAASSSFFGPGKSVTIEAYRDGLKHIIKGALGTLSISSDSGKYGKVKFEMMGEYQAVTDVAVPSPTFVTVNPPIWESSKVGICGFGTPVITKVEFNLNGKVILRDDARSANSIKGFVFADRDPKGSCQIESESVATFDAFGKLIAVSEGPTGVQFGNTAGNIVTVVAPKSQLDDVKYADRDSLLDFQIPLKFNRNTGDDSLIIVIC